MVTAQDLKTEAFAYCEWTGGQCDSATRSARPTWQGQDTTVGEDKSIRLPHHTGRNEVFMSVSTSTLVMFRLSLSLSLFLLLLGHPWNASFHFSFLILRHSVGFLARGISLSQGCYVQKHRINSDIHPCLEWDSNPRSQCLSERRQSCQLNRRTKGDKMYKWLPVKSGTLYYLYECKNFQNMFLVI
jgi:hypothetical protein